MLDTLKILKELERAIPDLYVTMQDQHQQAEMFVSWLRKNPDVVEQLKTLHKPYPVPQWEGLLDDVIEVVPQPHPYVVVATDGSQIYPDKHQGVPCYVLNTGSVAFIYGDQEAQAQLSSTPEVVTQQDEGALSEDIVNCARAEREFEVGLQRAREVRDEHPGLPFAFLCDGSLIFWHLENKSHALKERFLKRYIGLLDEFYQAKVPIAGYISLPKSKELTALLRNAVVHSIGPIKEGTSLHTLVDTDWLTFLAKNQRTAVFTHNSPLVKHYPEHLVPCFVYLRTEHEIARIEMPRWVAQNKTLLERVLALILDQSLKGNGYPVSLSEAHEQAVIKGHERELFFRMLRKMNTTRNYRITPSQKSLKKRYVSV